MKKLVIVLAVLMSLIIVGAVAAQTVSYNSATLRACPAGGTI